MSSSAHRLLRLWHRLAPLPGGKALFVWAFGRMVPYSGTIRPRIDALEPGHARVSLYDRRSVRNHLNSVHAIALANLGEMTGGLAMTAALPASVRGILLGIDVAYLKKARGTLTAECTCSVPEVTADVDHTVVTEIRDTAGDVVARVTARWRLGPVKRA